MDESSSSVGFKALIWHISHCVGYQPTLWPGCRDLGLDIYVDSAPFFGMHLTGIYVWPWHCPESAWVTFSACLLALANPSCVLIVLLIFKCMAKHHSKLCLKPLKGFCITRHCLCWWWCSGPAAIGTVVKLMSVQPLPLCTQGGHLWGSYWTRSLAHTCPPAVPGHPVGRSWLAQVTAVLGNFCCKERHMLLLGSVCWPLIFSSINLVSFPPFKLSSPAAQWV